VLARLYDLGAVNAAEYTEGGIRVSIALPPEEAAVFKQYLTTDEVSADERSVR